MVTQKKVKKQALPGKKKPASAASKRPKNDRGKHPPFTGTEGKKFTKKYQPPPEKKSEGWEKLRQKRLLTQKILEIMLEGDGSNLEVYVRKLILAASQGSSKAIETINKGMEDDILKIEAKVSDGSTIIDWTGKQHENNNSDSEAN